MLTKTTLVVLAAALFGVASSATAAPKHHARHAHMRKDELVRLLRTIAYAKDLRMSAPAPRFAVDAYPHKSCARCNANSY